MITVARVFICYFNFIYHFDNIFLDKNRDRVCNRLYIYNRNDRKLKYNYILISNANRIHKPELLCTSI